MGKKTTSKRKQEKYASHPDRAKANKLRRVRKQVKYHPNDNQAKADLTRLGG